MMRAVTKMPGNCAYFSPVVVAAAIAQLEVNELMLIILYLASPPTSPNDSGRRTGGYRDALFNIYFKMHFYQKKPYIFCNFFSPGKLILNNW